MFGPGTGAILLSKHSEPTLPLQSLATPVPLPPCVPSFIPNKGLPFTLLEHRERSVGQEGQAVGKMWNSWQRWLLGGGGQVFKARDRGKLMNYIKIETFYVTSFHYWFFGNFTPRTLILLISESLNILLHPCNTPQKRKFFKKNQNKTNCHRG